MMKARYTSLIIFAIGGISAFSQEATDSIDSSIELQEVVIQAPKVIRKADMDVLYPSASAVENSKNGMQLLNNLMIPTLNVNEVLGTVTTAGQSVQMRINGREASIQQVKELLPETIKRVEWIDNPGSLYNGRTERSYLERNAVTEALLTDVNTSIKDRNQAYGVTADYIKNWSKSRFTAGVSYTANRNRSVYEYIDGEIFHQRQDKVYFYGEYFQRLNKFTLTAGLGAQYTSFRFRETGQGNVSWNLRPQATLTITRLQ